MMANIFRRPIVWLILVSFLPLISFLSNPGMPFVHDGQDHVVRIANFYQALTEGIIIPRWGANLNWGYGHPVLMFLYPLPSYVAALFHWLGFSFVTSTKLVFIAAFVAGTLAMYLWMSSAFGKKAGIIGALLYSFAPYRFVDLHVRGAIGEHVAFVFPPLIMYLVLTKKWIGVSLSTAALILSHNALALMFLPVIGLYALYLLIFEETKRWPFIVSCLLSFILGFGVSAFFWIPALFEGKFTLRDIVTAGQIKEFVPWEWFFYSSWNYGGGENIMKSLGLPQWLGIASATVLLARSKQKKILYMIAGLLLLLVVSLFMMTSWSRPLWSGVAILQNFQFPWRFLSLSVFLAAAIGGIFFGQKAINNKLFIVYCLLTIVLTSWMWRPKGYRFRHESFYSGIYPGTTDTGESSPIWSTRFMEHTPANPLEVVDGEATVTNGRRTSTVHEYTLNATKPTLMLENTVYFPGWQIYLDGVPTGIQFQNPDYRGLMIFRVTEETKNVRVVFEDTKVRKFANAVSLVSMLMLGILSLWKKRKSYL